MKTMASYVNNGEICRAVRLSDRWFAPILAMFLIIETNIGAAVFTNGVKVVDDIFFAVTDYGPTNILDDLEVEATNRLDYVILGKGTNEVLRADIRQGEIPVVLDLRDAGGRPVARTPLGKANVLPPAELKHRRDRLPLRSTTFWMRPLGSISDFFDVKEPGTYTLEARLRYWSYTNNARRWFLTEPVRLRVIVRDSKFQNVPPREH